MTAELVISDRACNGRIAGCARSPVLPAGAGVRLCRRAPRAGFRRRHLPHPHRPDADRADAERRADGDGGERRAGRLPRRWSSPGWWAAWWWRAGAARPAPACISASSRLFSLVAALPAALLAVTAIDHARPRPRQLVLDAHARHRRQLAVAGPGLRRAAGGAAARRYPGRQARAGTRRARCTRTIRARFAVFLNSLAADHNLPGVFLVGSDGALITQAQSSERAQFPAAGGAGAQAGEEAIPTRW